MRIPFQEWLPDAAPFLAPGSPTMLNVQPDVGHHNPVNDIAATSTNALNARAQGAFSAQALDGTVFTFAGDATKLYQLSAGVWTDVSAGGGYALGASDKWSFTQFGQYVIATAGTENVQVWNMGTSSAFAALGGSPPKAKYCATIRDFVVIANTPTTGPQTVTWSGFENSTDWSITNNNQSGTQVLYDYGPILGITGGDTGYIFQRHAITRMTYVGSPLIFQFDTVSTDIGLGAQGALLKIGNMLYFWDNGFYAFGGTTIDPIGLGKWDQWFLANVDGSALDLISAAHDITRKTVYWGFVSHDALSTTQPDTILIYNYAIKQAAVAKVSHELLWNGITAGVTMEQLASQFPNLDTVPVTLDSPQWMGGAYQLLAFNPSHYLATFTGSTLAATLTTPEFEGVPGSRSRLINSRLLCDTVSASIKVNSRSRLGDTEASTIDSPMQANGDCPLLASGRYHVAQMDIPAATTWTYAQGIEFDAVPDGIL